MLNDYISNPQLSNLRIKSYSFKNLNEISPFLSIDYDIELRDFTSDLIDLIVFNIPFLSPALENVAFQGDNRVYDFYPEFLLNTNPIQEKVTIVISEGYEIPKLPKDVIIHNEFVTYDLKFGMEGNNLVVLKDLQFLDRKVPKKSFDAFRQDYLQILKSENQKIYYSAI